MRLFSSHLVRDDVTAALPLLKNLMFLLCGTLLGGAVFLVVNSSVNRQNDMPLAIRSVTNKEQQLGQSAAPATEHVFVVQLSDPGLHLETIRRFSTIYSYVSSQLDQDLLAILNLTNDESWIQSDRVRTELQAALLQRLVEHDPEIAMKFALRQRQPIRSRLTKVVYVEWSRLDVAAAVAYAQDLDIVSRKAALEGMIEAVENMSLARVQEVGHSFDLGTHAVSHYIANLNIEHLKDPSEHWYELVTTLNSDDTEGNSLILEVAHLWFQESGIEVVDEILESEVDKSFQVASVNRIFSTIAQKNPRLALRQARAVPFDGDFRWFHPTVEVIKTWARTNPFAALEAVQDFGPSGTREHLQRNAVIVWAESKPRHLLEHLDSIPKDTYQLAVAHTFSALADTDPEEAGALVLQFQNLKTRASAARSLVSRWTQIDIDSVLNWVLEYPHDEAARSQLLNSVLSTMIESDPVRAVEIGLQQPIREDEHIGLEASLVAALAFRDVERALELLPMVRAGASQSYSYRQLGVSLVANGEPERAMDLAGELPDAAKDRFYSSIAYEWAKIDPGATLEALADFPTAEIRSNVAQELSRLQAQFFSESELETLGQYLIKHDKTTTGD